MTRLFAFGAAAWICAGAGAFAVFAAFNDKPRIHVVKTVVNPVLIEGPTEVKR